MKKQIKIKFRWVFLILLISLPLFILLSAIHGYNPFPIIRYVDMNSGDIKTEYRIFDYTITTKIEETPFSKEVRRLGIEIPEERLWKSLEDNTYSQMEYESRHLIVDLEVLFVPDKGRIEIMKNVLEIFKTGDSSKIHDLREKLPEDYYVKGLFEDTRRIYGSTVDINEPDIRQNIQKALSNWKNDFLDPQPVIFVAKLYKRAKGSGRLFFGFYDEDLDALGIGITERYIENDGSQTIIIEEYSVYSWHSFKYEIEGQRRQTVQIRDAGQRKNEEQWQQYINNEKLKYSLPEVWISIPEPNKVEVEVYVYDRAGHKSEPVELMYDPNNSYWYSQ